MLNHLLLILDGRIDKARGCFQTRFRQVTPVTVEERNVISSNHRAVTETNQRSIMELFVIIVNSLKPLFYS